MKLIARPKFSETPGGAFASHRPNASAFAHANPNARFIRQQFAPQTLAGLGASDAVSAPEVLRAAEACLAAIGYPGQCKETPVQTPFGTKYWRTCNYGPGTPFFMTADSICNSPEGAKADIESRIRDLAAGAAPTAAVAPILYVAPPTPPPTPAAPPTPTPAQVSSSTSPSLTPGGAVVDTSKPGAVPVSPAGNAPVMPSGGVVDTLKAQFGSTVDSIQESTGLSGNTLLLLAAGAAALFFISKGKR